MGCRVLCHTAQGRGLSVTAGAAVFFLSVAHTVGILLIEVSLNGVGLSLGSEARIMGLFFGLVLFALVVATRLTVLAVFAGEILHGSAPFVFWKVPSGPWLEARTGWSAGLSRLSARFMGGNHFGNEHAYAWRAERDSNPLPAPVLNAAHPHVLSARRCGPAAISSGPLCNWIRESGIEPPFWRRAQPEHVKPCVEPTPLPERR